MVVSFLRAILTNQYYVGKLYSYNILNVDQFVVQHLKYITLDILLS
jgi:hypothetical protein